MNEDNIHHRKRIMRRSHKLNTKINNKIISDSFFIFNNDRQQQQPQQRMVCARKKTEGLMCSICEGPAHGYNFDAITCESCKAFFRRNGLKSDEKFKCRVNNGQCVITVSTRKRCKACRLAKCFEKGMRADWILTDQERMNKRQKIEDNRRLRQTLYPDSSETDEIQIIKPKGKLYDNNEEKEDTDDDDDDDEIVSTYITPLRSFLSSKDLIKIKQIKQAYIDSVRLTSLPPEIPSYPYTVRITEQLDMLNFPTNIQATRLITYFKLLPEFSSLNEHDKLVLIKYNTFTLSLIRGALNYDRLTDSYHEPNTDDCVFSGRDIIQCFSLYRYEQTTRCICNFLNSSLGDRFILEVILIIILFSKGSSVCTFIDSVGEVEPIAQDILSIYQAQNIFIDLLWKYCEHKFGFSKTINIWLKLTISSMDAHIQQYNTRHGCVKVDSIVVQLSPLMKSVMLVN